MKAKLRNLSPTAASMLVAVGSVFVLVLGLFVLVLPQSHKSKQLTDEIAKTQAQIVAARALATQRPEQRIRVADLFKVVEAMPDDNDMTGVMLQIQQTASEAGVKFDSITPQVAEAGAGYQVQPIDLTFDGNYYSLTDFLFRLRKLVNVHHGELDATGRLFAVGRLDFAAAEQGFPAISATVRVNAFTYSPTTGLTPADGATTDTTTTTTTTTPSSGASASGVTP
jgi:Tfp pilus assembly protein PilO